MNDWNRWDFALLALAGYIAVIALVRLMLARREQVVARLRAELQQQRQQQAATPPADAASTRSGQRAA